MSDSASYTRCSCAEFRIKKEGYFTLRKKKFDEREKHYDADHLRGGNWSAPEEETEELLPEMAVIVLDTHSGLDSRGGRMDSLKTRIRQRFDCGGASVVHSTDTTLEAREYIRICFRDEAAELEEEIRNVKGSSRHSLKERLAFYPRILEYYYKRTFNFIKNIPLSVLKSIVKRFLHH